MLSMLNGWFPARRHNRLGVGTSPDRVERSSAKASRRARTRTTLMIEPCERRSLLAVSLAKLDLGSTSGPGDYDYTAGGKVVAAGAVGCRKFYDIGGNESRGARRNPLPRTPAPH